MRFIVLSLYFAVYININGQTVVEKSGDITTDEVWSADTVKITGEINIANGNTVAIDPGVYIEFQEHYKISLQGCLLA